MSRLVKFEKLLERRFDRLRRPDTPRELIEAIPEVLDDVEDHLEPSGGRGRAFPYDRVRIAFVAAPAERAAARSLFQDLPERIRQRLRTKGFEAPEDLAIEVRYTSEAGEDWAGRPFRIRYHRRRAAPPAAAKPEPPAATPALRLTVVRGRTGEKEHDFKIARVNLGRLEKVANTSGKAPRKNHVWFAASEDTVSRAHAHLERVGADWLIFDDGSASGTRVLRRDREIELMPKASRGVKLEPGDRIELGKGCVIEVGKTD